MSDEIITVYKQTLQLRFALLYAAGIVTGFGLHMVFA